MIGKAFSHYEITALLGKGGMGEVYRARDSKLKRDVALKFVPPELAADPQHLARLRREATALARIQHPNVATIHGLEETDEGVAIVMELIEGDPLDARMKDRKLDSQQTRRIGSRIADGLAAVHAEGLLHRDLKPGNVMLGADGSVKVVDFGLARSEVAEDDETRIVGDETGFIVGTPAYMSPEQRLGSRCDARSDIWSLGAILYECASGKSIASGADLDAIADPGLRRTVAFCLAEDRADRIDSAHAVALMLRAEPIAPEPARGPGLGLAALAIAAFAIGVGGGAFFFGTGQPDLASAESRHFEFVISPDPPREGLNPAISPRGDRITYVHDGGLYVRELNAWSARRIHEAPRIALPCWSPDGTAIAFAQDQEVYRIAPEGGDPRLIGQLSGAPSGATGGLSWNDQDWVIVSSGGSGIFRAPARGGEFEALTTPPDGSLDIHNSASVPGSDAVIYVSHRWIADQTEIWLHTPDGDHRSLLKLPNSNAVASHPFIAPSGHLLFGRSVDQPGIWAVPIDLSALEVHGTPVRVAPVGNRPSVSRDGTLLFDYTGGLGNSAIVTLEPGRARTVLAEEPATLSRGTISSDGKLLAHAMISGESGSMWVRNLENGQRSRIANDLDGFGMLQWSPSGELLVLTLRPSPTEPMSVHLARLDGTTTPLTEGEYAVFANDDRRIVFMRGPRGDRKVFEYDLEAGGEREIQLRKENARFPRVSPDGRWIAYVGGPDARLFVSRYPSGEGNWQISSRAALHPVWGDDGKTLLWVHPATGELVSAALDFTAGVSSQPEQIVLHRDDWGSSFPSASFELHPQTGEIVYSLARPTGTAFGTRIAVVENWTDLLGDAGDR